MAVAHFVALNARAVPEHDAGDIARGRRHVDWTRITGLDQARKPADVVVVRVRDDHGIESRGSNVSWRFGLVGSILSASNSPQSSKSLSEPISNK